VVVGRTLALPIRKRKGQEGNGKHLPATRGATKEDSVAYFRYPAHNNHVFTCFSGFYLIKATPTLFHTLRPLRVSVWLRASACTCLRHPACRIMTS